MSRSCWTCALDVRGACMSSDERAYEWVGDKDRSKLFFPRYPGEGPRGMPRPNPPEECPAYLGRGPRSS